MAIVHVQRATTRTLLMMTTFLIPLQNVSFLFSDCYSNNNNNNELKSSSHELHEMSTPVMLQFRPAII